MKYKHTVKIILACCFLSSAFFLTSCNANKKALEFYNNRQFEKALEICKPRAEKNDASCAFLIGVLYYNGIGVVQSQGEAYKWIKKAADLNHGYAKTVLSGMLLKGLGTPRNEKEGMELLQSTADDGFPEAKYVLGANLISRGGDDNITKGKKYILEAATAGNLSAQMYLGSELCANDPNSDECVKDGVAWLQKAAATGELVAERSLGYVYYAQKNYEQSVQPLKRAALKGDSDSQWIMALIYMAGGGYVDGLKWMLVAKDNNQENAKQVVDIYKEKLTKEIIAESEAKYEELKKTIAFNKLVEAKKRDLPDLSKSFYDIK